MNTSIGIPINKFYNNSNIISVFFSSNCEFIGSNAFGNCINLKEINDNNEIKEIGSFAFANCKNLSEITFNKLTTLHEDAFACCSNLTNTKIPNCKIIPQNAFCECSSLSIDMASIEEIGSFAFLNCKNLKEINLNSCKLIYDNAFMNCESLTNVILSTCTSIYPNAFLGCTSLNKVLIYNDSNTFCNLLSSTSFDKNTNALFYFKPDTISSYISADNWSHFSSNMRILPADNQIKYETTDRNPLDAYYNYGGIEGNDRFIDNDMITIVYKNNIDSIGKNIFKELFINKVTDIQLPGSCEKIEESAFEDFTNLSNITLPNTLTEISDCAFKNCKDLYTFNIPQSVTSLGEGIFEGCDNIYQINGKFVTYNNEVIVCNNTLIFVIPNVITKFGEIPNDRIYNISDIDKNITRLGKSCFYGCKNIGRVNIPSYIESIGDYCFYNSDISEIHFEGNIPPQFGQNICGNNVRIFVPENSLLDYYNALVSSGNNITNIYPKPENNSIIYYSNNEISGLNNQEYINKDCTNGNYYRITNINNGILPTNYFNNQSEVTTVILSENIIEISQKAFEKCSSLKYIYLPETLTTLGESCFCKCTSMRDVNIPSNVKKPKNNIFEECTNLVTIKSYNKEYISTIDNRCFTHSGEIISFAPGRFGKDGDTYNIPHNITSICNKAFYKCTNGYNSQLRKITLSESVKTIGDNAFGESTLLQSVSLSQNLKSIGNKAFYNCTNLTEIIFENGSSSSNSLDLETIGVSAFEKCGNMFIKSDKDFGNIITIKESAFKNCTNFVFKKLSNNEETNLNLTKVTNINKYSFHNCTNLKKITLNDNITTIGDYAFYSCQYLETLNLPTTLTTIGIYAFYNCNRLKTLNLPTTLTTIGNYAFYNCNNFKGYNYIDNSNENIRSITNEMQNNYILKIPKNVTSIGSNCFSKTSIEKIEIDKDSKLTKIPDYAFYFCTKLKMIDIKSPNITHIGKYAFYNCKELCETISNTNQLQLNNIQVVDDYAFKYCNKITYITFSSNLKTLGHECLYLNGTSIAQVFISNPTPPIFTNSNIDNTDSSPFGTKIPRIIVPYNSIDIYKRNKYWNKYANYLFTTSIIS